MSGLALLSGYGSDSEDDGERQTPDAVKLKNDSTTISRMVIDNGIAKGLLPSAMDLLSNMPGIKRKHSCDNTPSVDQSEKISRIATKKFVPPQVRSDRSNVVTEDTKHR